LDGEECILEAAQKIQPAMGVIADTGFSTPGTTYCNSMGGMTTCNTVGGVNIPGSAMSYDANRSTRQLYLKVCMEKKGYVQVPSKWCQDPNDETTEDCVTPIHQ
jgi:hypothetical protein